MITERKLTTTLGDFRVPGKTLGSRSLILMVSRQKKASLGKDIELPNVRHRRPTTLPGGAQPGSSAGTNRAPRGSNVSGSLKS